MGYFSLGSKIHRPTSPSLPSLSPYHETGSSPLTVAETSTTRTEFVTTTETTSHFFPLPGWRKRTSTLESSLIIKHTPMAGLPKNSNHPTATHSMPSSRDKALPPTPVKLLTRRPSQSYEQETIPSSSSTSNHSVPHSPSVLARTALGLGLPHVMPHISPSIPTSVSQPNTITLINLSPRHSTTDTSSPRRSKSSQRLEKTIETLQVERTSTSDTNRRPRVLSLLSSSHTSPRVSSEESHTRDKEALPIQQSLTRKSSFWNRKKQKELQQARPSTAHGDLFRPKVGVEVDLSDLPLPQPRRQKLQARDPVSRSVSERPQTYHPKSPDASPKASVMADGSTPLNRNSTERNLYSSVPVRANTTGFSEPQDTEKALTSRIRSQTNPPLLHRLSMNMFSTTPSFFTTSPVSSPGSLPQVQHTNASHILDRTTPVVIPRPLENEETPETYLERLMDVVTKVEVTAILASSSEPFYATALKVFIGRFNFVGDPLDISLRRLLMEVGLPKETQQIDRVIEAFAKRYIECNPNLYVSEDHPYILAFSLIMLHTDAFNKSNKRKMSKADYVKNTKISGVPTEILEYFYDNIIFAPFIFIEDQDPLDYITRHDLGEPTRRSLAIKEGSLSNPQNSAGSPLTAKPCKVDPYHMIMNNLLDPLRIPVDRYIPIENPFSYTGTLGSWNEEELLRTFVEARTIEVYLDTNRSSPFFGLIHGEPSSPKSSNLRMAKVGVLHCKDDYIQGGRKATYRKWRSLGVVLTGSQLLFSRDATWINTMLAQTGDSHEPVSTPQPEILKVDELISIKNVIAVYDSSYTKHRNTFRLVLSDGRHLLFQAPAEDDMNQWIARINYASAFISTGVRMRMLGMSDHSMQLTGVAVATLHLHDIQNRLQSSPLVVGQWDDDAPAELLGMLSGDEFDAKKPQRVQRKVTLKVVRDEVELEAKNTLEVEKKAEFKNTFEKVKADLAASLKQETVMDNGDSEEVKLHNPTARFGHLRLPPRSQMMQEKVAELDAQLKKTEEQLGNELRFVHNVATLAPFQKATRDRLLAAIQTMTRRVMLLRLDIVRTLCHRKVLQNDIVAENRVWTEVKCIALQTAKETLSSRSNPQVPQMSHSVHHSQPTSPLQGTDVYRHKRPESSICESFHTAIDSGTSDDLGSTYPGTWGVFDSSPSGSLSSLPFPEIDGNSSRVWKSEPTLISGSCVGSGTTPNAGDEGSDTQHERFYTAQESPAEEAEEWHQTRCAQRVSLVRVPSNIGLVEFGKRLGVCVEKTGGVG